MDSFDDALNSSDSSEFFSPISLSFFQPNKKATSKTPEPLPPSHDTSWIGARLSPIRSFDKDEDEEDSIENIKTALHYPVEQQRYTGVHEQTRLLRPSGKTVSFHPRYTETASTTVSPNNNNNNSTRSWTKPTGTGLLICTLSAVQLGAAMIHSLIYSEDSSSVSFLRRMAYWLWRPDPTSLVWLGALETSSLANRAYWRMGTSLFCSTTVGEWLLVWMAWTVLCLFQRRTQHRQFRFSSPQIWSIYVTSAVTGQLWMFAWENELNNGRRLVTTGCLSWGTCGILCAGGIVQPQRRFYYFVLAIVLTVGACLQRPYNSILGTLGGSYFGWALGAAGMVSPRGLLPVRSIDLTHAERLHQWRSATAAIFMWVLPVLWIAFSAEA